MKTLVSHLSIIDSNMGSYIILIATIICQHDLILYIIYHFLDLGSPL